MVRTATLFLLILPHIAIAAAPVRPTTPRPVRPMPPPRQVPGEPIPVQNPNAEIKPGDKARLNLKLTDRTEFTGANCRGKLTVLYFWMSGQLSMDHAPELTQLQAKYADKGLQVIGLNGDREKATMDDTIQKLGLTWPQYWNGSWRLDKVFQQWGINRLPTVALIGPDATVLYVGVFPRLETEMEKALLNHRPGVVQDDELSEAMGNLAAARTALGINDILAAYRAFAAVTPSAAKDAVVARQMGDLRVTLYHRIKESLTAADDLITQQKNAEAALSLKAILATIPGMTGEAEAKKKLDDLLARPEIRQEVQAAERNAAAATALTQARKLRDTGNDIAAYARFKAIVMDYASTPYAKDAAAAVKTYDDDPVFQRKLRDTNAAAKAKSMLHLAETYHSSNRDDLAKKKYQEIIDKFPDTSYADQAKAAMAQLPASK